MTPRQALEAGELYESIDLQTEVVANDPANRAARLFLAELFLVSGQLNQAHEELLELDDPDSHAVNLLNLLKAQAERRRAHPLVSGHWPDHARLRRRAWRAYRRNQRNVLAKLIDQADSFTPHLSGHVDGREFDGLRDVDDRFASVLEVFIGRDYTWIPLEHLQHIQLQPPQGVADIAFRPARLRMNNRDHDVILPLIYPETHWEDDEELLLGLGTDYPVVTPAAAIAVGQRIWTFGEELAALGDCSLIEFLPRRSG